MRKLLYYEWLHFSRNKARPITVVLFLMAAAFSLNNGASSYQERINEIKAINEKRTETIEEAKAWLNEGVAGPEARPWVDISTPFWSMWYATHYMVQEPSPTMIYNVGQAEHFGYYKRVSMWTTAFDADLTAEIANPELVQMGALDFTFVWLYLMPLMLIVLTYHTKGLEQDLGFIPLLKVQLPSLNGWFLQRLLILGLVMLILLTVLLFIPTFFHPELDGLASLWTVYSLYLLLWLVLIYIVILFGKGQADQALKLVGLWLLLIVAIPGLVNQYVLLKKPAGLMMDMIEAGREGQNEIFEREQDIVVTDTKKMLPELSKLEVTKHDSLLKQPMISGAYRLVLNKYMNEVTTNIIEDQKDRNQLIKSSYWLNPVTAFHNWLNDITQTGHEANLEFRERIRAGGETINKTLVLDEWRDKKMDQSAFEQYVELLNDR